MNAVWNEYQKKAQVVQLGYLEGVNVFTGTVEECTEYRKNPAVLFKNNRCPCGATITPTHGFYGRCTNKCGARFMATIEKNGEIHSVVLWGNKRLQGVTFGIGYQVEITGLTHFDTHPLTYMLDIPGAIPKQVYPGKGADVLNGRTCLVVGIPMDADKDVQTYELALLGKEEMEGNLDTFTLPETNLLLVSEWPNYEEDDD